jgi:hypothetical protein
MPESPVALAQGRGLASAAQGAHEDAFPFVALVSWSTRSCILSLLTVEASAEGVANMLRRSLKRLSNASLNAVAASLVDAMGAVIYPLGYKKKTRRVDFEAIVPTLS